MKKKLKQIAAIAALAVIAIILIAFVVTAITGDADSSSRFGVLLIFGIIALPIFAWIMIFFYGLATHQHTMASIFQEGGIDRIVDILQGSAPADSQGLTDEEITAAMEHSKDSQE